MTRHATRRRANDPVRWIFLALLVAWLVLLTLFGGSGARVYGQVVELPEKAVGLVELKQTFSTGWIDGPEWNYQGVMEWRRWPAVAKARAATIRYTGPAGSTAILVTANGPIFDGVNLFRHEYSRDAVPWDGCVGYELRHPASAAVIANQRIAGFDTAILIGKSNHCEHLTLTNVHSAENRVFFRNEESQAVGHSMRGIYSSRRFETLFEFVALPNNNGGGMDVDINTVVVQYPGLVLDIQKSNVNSQDLAIRNLKIDGGNMEGWRLIRQRNGAPVVKIFGVIGKDAPPAADAIDCENPQNIQIEMQYLGRIWPREFQVVNGKWEPK
jgi:hypothetical protein